MTICCIEKKLLKGIWGFDKINAAKFKNLLWEETLEVRSFQISITRIHMFKFKTGSSRNGIVGKRLQFEIFQLSPPTRFHKASKPLLKARNIKCYFADF